MANRGDSYIVTLNEAHLGWGEYRNTETRDRREREAYLPIPIKFSREHGVYNSNGTAHCDVLGKNIFNCQSTDKSLNCQMKAQGCERAGDIYAKQFAVNDDLRGLNAWYTHIDATVGDQICVTWKSPTDIVLEKI